MVHNMKSPTLEEIAKAAGVSRSTVSRVINNEPHVRTEVRERVWQTVEQMGYQPNAAARSLVNRRSQLLGVVIPETVNTVFIDPFFPILLQGIHDAASKRGYQLMLSMLGRPSEEEDFYRHALRRQMLDGLAIASALLDDPLIPYLLKDRTPFVIIGRHSSQRAINYVDVDNYAGARMAVQHLIKQGRQRVATITGPQQMVAGIDRLEGYKSALRHAGIALDEALIVEGDFTEISGYTCMKTLLAQDIDAVFVASDPMAMGALRAIHQAGRTIPQDIALVGYDDAQVATFSNPPLTTVRQPIYELGGKAIDLLVQLANDRDQEPSHIILPTELVIRASCGA